MQSHYTSITFKRVRKVEQHIFFIRGFWVSLQEGNREWSINNGCGASLLCLESTVVLNIIYDNAVTHINRNVLHTEIIFGSTAQYTRSEKTEH